MTIFTVVTEVSDTDYALALPSVDQAFDGHLTPLHEVVPGLALMMRMPVFTLGEIMFLDISGREIAGHGRKPSKWGVVTEEFDEIDDAIARAVEVTDWTGEPAEGNGE